MLSRRALLPYEKVSNSLTAKLTSLKISRCLWFCVSNVHFPLWHWVHNWGQGILSPLLCLRVGIPLRLLFLSVYSQLDHVHWHHPVWQRYDPAVHFCFCSEAVCNWLCFVLPVFRVEILSRATEIDWVVMIAFVSVLGGESQTLVSPPAPVLLSYAKLTFISQCFYVS